MYPDFYKGKCAFVVTDKNSDFLVYFYRKCLHVHNNIQWNVYLAIRAADSKRFGFGFANPSSLFLDSNVKSLKLKIRKSKSMNFSSKIVKINKKSKTNIQI